MAAMPEHAKFFDEIKDYVSFEDGGFSYAKEKRAKEIADMLNEAEEYVRTAEENVKIELDHIKKEIIETGRPKQEAELGTKLWAAWAKIQSAPVSFLKKAKFVRGEEGTQNRNVYASPMRQENMRYVTTENGSKDYGLVPDLAATDSKGNTVNIKKAPVRLQVGFHVGDKNSSNGAGFAHIQKHKDALGKYYNSTPDAIKEILANFDYITKEVSKDDKERLTVYKQLNEKVGVRMVLDLQKDNSTDEDFYSVVTIAPANTKQMANKQKEALSFNGRQTPNTDHGAGANWSLGDNEAVNPEVLMSGKESAYGTVSLSEAEKFVNEYIAEDEQGNKISLENGLFQFAGEQGAANLDRAEEVTTRLDNLAMYKHVYQTTGTVVVGVEEGQQGRIITSFVFASDKKHKNAALRGLKNYLNTAYSVDYISHGLSGYSRPEIKHSASTGNTPLHAPDTNNISDNYPNSNTYNQTSPDKTLVAYHNISADQLRQVFVSPFRVYQENKKDDPSGRFQVINMGVKSESSFVDNKISQFLNYVKSNYSKVFDENDKAEGYVTEQYKTDSASSDFAL